RPPAPWLRQSNSQPGSWSTISPAASAVGKISRSKRRNGEDPVLLAQVACRWRDDGPLRDQQFPTCADGVAHVFLRDEFEGRRHRRSNGGTYRSVGGFLAETPRTEEFVDAT